MTTNNTATKFINDAVAKIEPVLKACAIAHWNATTTGKKKWYKECEKKEIEYRRIMADKGLFKQVAAIRKARISDPILKRQIELLYLAFLENQIGPRLNKELVRRSVALEKKFNSYRAKIGGVKTPDNKIRKILRNSIDVNQRKGAWEASKQVGKVVAGDLIALVKKRNKAARSLGFKNYYQMHLKFQEQDEKTLFSLFGRLASLTDKPFKKLKSEIDAVLAKRYKIKPKDLRPWHYEDPFFQEAPQIYNISLDKYFKDRDILKIIKNYYKKIGLPTDDIIAHSDLYECKGKEQHAFCMHIDRLGDIRVLANIVNDEYWAEAMLHELGHAVYEKFFDKKLPYLLREPSHIFITEAIAEMFGALTMNPAWLAAFAAPDKKAEFKSLTPILKKVARLQKLILARWIMVMAYFERGLYSNPNQNLNKLWWNIVEKYQMVKRPEGRNSPDWAAKIHLTSSPCYYHNYLLGELLVAQLLHYIEKNIAPRNRVFIKGRGLGEYLKTKFFAIGNKMRWDKFIKYTTGEKFMPKYFAQEYLK